MTLGICHGSRMDDTRCVCIMVGIRCLLSVTFGTIDGIRYHERSWAALVCTYHALGHRGRESVWYAFDVTPLFLLNETIESNRNRLLLLDSG